LKSRSFILGVIAIILVTALSGCVGNSVEKNYPQDIEDTSLGDALKNVMEFNLPKTDVSGEDLEDVPRYEPSVRIEYIREDDVDGYSINLQYYTKDSESDVTSFYTNEMPSYGWKLKTKKASSGVIIQGVEVGGGTELDFVNKSCYNSYDCTPSVSINIQSLELGDETYTTITIYYQYYNYSYMYDSSGLEPLESEDSYGFDNWQDATPTSGLGKEVDDAVRRALERALNTDMKVESFYEMQNTASLSYLLRDSIEDTSSVAQNIQNELSKEGIFLERVFFSVDQDHALLQMKATINGKRGMLNVEYYNGSNYIDVLFVEESKV